MPRLTPITGKSDVPAEHHGVVDAVVKVFGNVRGPFSMLLHSPKLAERLGRWSPSSATRAWCRRRSARSPS